MKRKHSKALSFLALLFAFSLVFTSFVGCSTKEETPDPSSQSAAPVESKAPEQETNDTITLTDPSGETVVLPKEVNTIVSMAPAITQVLIDLDVADKIIAVDTQSSQMFGEVSALPAFDMFAPEPEKIIVLNPDLLLSSNLSAQGGESPFSSAKDAGIAVATIPSSDSIAGIATDIQFIADTVGAGDKGNVIVTEMNKAIDEFRSIGESIPEDQKKTVYFEISALPDLYSFGNGVFLNEMIEIIGAENILAAEDSWLAVSEETVIAENPDVILTSVTYIENPTEEILSRTGWENITAISEKAVYSIDPNTSSQPNHHIVEALEEMATAVHPDYFN